MNLKSRKATMYIIMALIVLLMPVVPVFVDASTTNSADAKSANSEQTTERTASYVDNTMDILAANDRVGVELSLFEGKAVAIVSPYIEVRQTADEESDTVGILYESNIADVVEQFGEWTKIQSGNLVGYVKSETLCFGDEAKAIAMLQTEITGLVVAESVTQYADKTFESHAIGVLNEGDKVVPISTIGAFVKIQLDENVAYVAKEDIEINYGFENGMTNEEIAEKEAREEAERVAAAQAEAARIAAEEAKRAQQEALRQQMIQNTKDGTDVTYNPTMSISDDDLWILACIIDWESGWESYEGKLAVANVVLNRVRGGYYGNTVADVVYARGQFSGVMTSSGAISSQFATRLANGPRTTDCMRAAMEALSGVNNVGSYTSFIGVSSANVSAYPDYMIIGNHCFH